MERSIFINKEIKHDLSEMDIFAITIFILVTIFIFLYFIKIKPNQINPNEEFFQKLENLVMSDDVYDFRQELKHPVIGKFFSIKNSDIKGVFILVAESVIGGGIQFVRIYIEKTDGNRIYDRNFSDKNEIKIIFDIIEKGRLNLFKKNTCAILHKQNKI